MLSLWSQRVSDLLIVAIKLYADENMVTWLRIKRTVSGRKTKGEGADTLTKAFITIDDFNCETRKKEFLNILDPPYEASKDNSGQKQIEQNKVR